MRYFYQPKQQTVSRFSAVYICDHPVYSRCTLYKFNVLGLAVIQQRFDPREKSTYWAEVDAGIADDIYRHPKFYQYFRRKAAEPRNGLYPTVTVRQIMWALKMKPLKREQWETVFDRAEI